MADVIYTESESIATVSSTEDNVQVVSTVDSGGTVTTEARPPVQIVSVVADTTVIFSETVSVELIESIGIGPQGIQGIQGIPGNDGVDGVDAVGAIPGILTGDFLRWNEEENKWEVKSEPIEFNQIVLTPAVAAILDKEGGLWYDSVNKSVMVCTSDH